MDFFLLAEDREVVWIFFFLLGAGLKEKSVKLYSFRGSMGTLLRRALEEGIKD